MEKIAVTGGFERKLAATKSIARLLLLAVTESRLKSANDDRLTVIR
jgi:hypothetical protein